MPVLSCLATIQEALRRRDAARTAAHNAHIVMVQATAAHDQAMQNLAIAETAYENVLERVQEASDQ